MTGGSRFQLMVAAMAAALAAGPAAGPAAAQGACPAVTVAASQGLKGAFPQQFELAEFEQAGKCKLVFKANPEIEALNAARISGKTDDEIRLLVRQLETARRTAI